MLYCTSALSIPYQMWEEISILSDDDRLYGNSLGIGMQNHEAMQMGYYVHSLVLSTLLHSNKRNYQTIETYFRVCKADCKGFISAFKG